MPTEPDQTRWVGIRPTPACGDIPVDAVRPAGTVSDLQAIKDTIGGPHPAANKDCTTSYTIESAAVVAGDLWVITNIAAENTTSMCDIIIGTALGLVSRTIKAFYSVPANIVSTWDGYMVLKEDEKIEVMFELGGGVDDIIFWVTGYKIGLY